MRLVLASLLLVFALAAPAAQAQTEPVEITVEGLFGPELLLPQRHVPLRVKLRNRTAGVLRGEVVVSASNWQSRPERHRVEVSLPPRGERTTQITVYANDGGTLTADFEIDGRRVARQHAPLSYDGARSGLVVLADPPRVRGSLLDLQRDEPQPYGSSRMLNVPVGVVSFDPRSGRHGLERRRARRRERTHPRTPLASTA